MTSKSASAQQQHGHSLHTTSMADLTLQLIATKIGRYLTAVDLLRCQGVNQQLYRAFACTPLARLTYDYAMQCAHADTDDGQRSAKRARLTVSQPHVSTTSHVLSLFAHSAETFGHLAWVGSTWKPTNTELSHVFHKINWKSLGQLEHLRLLTACRHMPAREVHSLITEHLPNYCHRLRSLYVPASDTEGQATYSINVAAWQQMTMLEDLQLSGVAEFVISGASVILCNPRLHTLILLDCPLPPSVLLPTHLRVLKLSADQRITPTYIRGIAITAGTLEHLSLRAGQDVHMQVDDYVEAMHELLTACVSLQELTLHRFPMPKQTLQFISSIASLRALKLAKCYHDNTTVEGLLLLHQIDSLIIQDPACRPPADGSAGNWSPPHDIMPQLMSLPSLTSLIADKLRAGHSEWLQQTPSLSQITTFKVLGDGALRFPWDVDECQHFCRVLPSLTELMLPPDCQIDDECLSTLSTRLPALTSLAVRPNHCLTVAGLSSLAKLSQLQRVSVNVNGTVVTVQQLLQVVGQQPMLTYLALGCDDLLSQLAGKSLLQFIPYIRKLSITCNPSWERQLSELVMLCAQLPVLKELTLRHKSVSPERSARLFQTFMSCSYSLRATSPAQFNIED